MESTGIKKGMVINFGRTSGINGDKVDFIYVNEEGLVYPVLI